MCHVLYHFFNIRFTLFYSIYFENRVLSRLWSQSTVLLLFCFVLLFGFVCVQLGVEMNRPIWFCYLRSAVIGWHGEQRPFTGLCTPSFDGFLLVNGKICVLLFLWKPHVNMFRRDANELIDDKIILRPNFFFNVFHLPCTYHHHALFCLERLHS